MTRDEAIAFYNAEKWNPMTLDERADFQLAERCLCMPFEVFHEAVTHALGRPVWTHEFANAQALIDERAGRIAKATMKDVMAKLPADKTIVVRP
jgi:hypothetical protein